MMNVNPAAFNMPMQQQQHEALFAQGRALTPQHQQSSVQQPSHFFNQNVPQPYPQSVTPQQLHHQPQAFPGGYIPPQGNGSNLYGGAALIQPGFPNQTPVSQPHHPNAPYGQPPTPTSAPSSNFPPSSLPASSASMAAPTPMNPTPPQHQQRSNPQMAQQQSQTNSQRPLSPTSAAREKARVSTLLEINAALLQEVVNLQAQGKAGVPAAAPGHTSPSQNTPTDPTGPSPTTTPTVETPTDQANGKPASKQPTREYYDCMRRLQANLAYLATIADRAKKPGAVNPAGPAILEPPPHLASVFDLYGKLKALFPDALKPGQGNHQQGSQRSGMQQMRTNAGIPTPTSA